VALPVFARKRPWRRGDEDSVHDQKGSSMAVGKEGHWGKLGEKLKGRLHPDRDRREGRGKRQEDLLEGRARLSTRSTLGPLQVGPRGERDGVSSREKERSLGEEEKVKKSERGCPSSSSGGVERRPSLPKERKNFSQV